MTAVVSFLVRRLRTRCTCVLSGVRGLRVAGGLIIGRGHVLMPRDGWVLVVGYGIIYDAHSMFILAY